MAPLGREHDQVQRRHRLDLAPGRAPAARLVGRADGLDHHALVTRRQRVGQQLGGRARVVGDDVADAPRRRHPPERLEPGTEREVEQVLAIEVQHVEPRRGQAAARPVVAAEAAHGVLEAVGPIVGIEADHLAIEYHRVNRQRRDDLDHAGQPVGHVVEVAREQADVGPLPVRLHAGAVELPLDRAQPELGDRRGHVRCGRRQHRQHGPEHLQPHAGQPLDPVGECDRRHVTDVATQHHRAPHGIGGDAGGPRHRIGDHTGQRALAHLADQQATQVVGLVRRAPAQQRGEHALAGGDRAGAGEVVQLAQDGVDLSDRQRGLRRRWRRQRREGRPPDPDPALPRLAGQHRHRHLALAGRQATQRVGEQGDLGGAGSRRADRLRGGHELGEQRAAG